MSASAERLDHAIAIRRLSAAEMEGLLDDLGRVMAACVADGASIGYILPFAAADGAAFWRDHVLPSVRAGRAVFFAGFVADRVCGTAVLSMDLPPNQPHRADVRKLMVDPAARRRGLARALMDAVEAEARKRGLKLLVLDTRTGDAAEPLYLSMGYDVAGIIPDYCIDAIDQERLDPTTVMYKRL